MSNYKERFWASDKPITIVVIITFLVIFVVLSTNKPTPISYNNEGSISNYTKLIVTQGLIVDKHIYKSYGIVIRNECYITLDNNYKNSIPPRDCDIINIGDNYTEWKYDNDYFLSPDRIIITRNENVIYSKDVSKITLFWR